MNNRRLGDDNMLGTIIAIEENIIQLKLNIALDKVQNLINLHVVMEDGEHRFVGEIGFLKKT